MNKTYINFLTYITGLSGPAKLAKLVRTGTVYFVTRDIPHTVTRVPASFAKHVVIAFCKITATGCFSDNVCFVVAAFNNLTLHNNKRLSNL